MILLARAQTTPSCVAHIIVDDTVLFSNPYGGTDSVRYHLMGPTDADSLMWMPDTLFANPTATSQWLTVACGDTVPVSLTAFYFNVNLFHWQQPDFVSSHTQYHYFYSPADGDFCQPRSITVDNNPHDYCSEMAPSYQRSLIIRPDTLRCYADSIQPFFHIDSLSPVSHLNALLPYIQHLPYDSAFVPFYIDTIDFQHPDPNYTHVLNLNHFTVTEQADSLYSVPLLVYTVHFDDTTTYFFGPGRNVRLCDTLLVHFLNYAVPQPAGNGPSRFITSTHHFNMRPRPRGKAVFRFYETPTPYYHTTSSYCFSRIEMMGYCSPTDSILLTGPQCGCMVRDTATRSVCRSQLPYRWDTLTFPQPGIDSLFIHSLECDTLRYYHLTLLPDDTLTRHDTIVQNQLPWSIYDTTYLFAGSDTLWVHGVLPHCDTLLYYHLTVIENVFDTTLTYICPGQLPYTLAGTTVYGDTLFTQQLIGSLGQDSLVTHILHVNPNSDTAIYDTILSSQLPWGFLDSLFTDSVNQMPFILTNEVGCDSVVYYNLFIFWEGDHCDSLLTFPNVVTPNGDGINDRFVIGGLVENQCYPYNLLLIVDRTGRVVFRGENIYSEDQFWDPASQHAPAGTYFYRFVGRGIHHATQHNGCIEVLR